MLVLALLDASETDCIVCWDISELPNPRAPTKATHEHYNPADSITSKPHLKQGPIKHCTDTGARYCSATDRRLPYEISSPR